MYDFQEQTVYAVFVLIFLKTLYRAANIFFSLERTYVPLRDHLGWTSKVLVGHHYHHVHNANYKSLFSVEPSASEEILLENNNITVSCKQICSQASHFYQKLQEKRMNFRPTSFQNPLFLACNHVTRRSYWWCFEGHYNRMFFRRIYMKIGFSSRRREMLMLLTLTHHQYGCCDAKCKPAL